MSVSYYLVQNTYIINISDGTALQSKSAERSAKKMHTSSEIAGKTENINENGKPKRMKTKCQTTHDETMNRQDTLFQDATEALKCFPTVVHPCQINSSVT